MTHLRTRNPPRMVYITLVGRTASSWPGVKATLWCTHPPVSSDLSGHPARRPGIQRIERLVAIAAWAASADFEGLGFDTAAIPAETQFCPAVPPLRRYHRSDGTTAPAVHRS